MNQFVSSALCLILLCAAACAKKAAKPARTEPWLAHPKTSTHASDAAAGDDAALPLARYVLTEQSSIRIELRTLRGAIHGTISRVSGELSVDASDLTRSHAQVRADLESLTLQGADPDSDGALLTRARSALDLSGAGAPSAIAHFELTRLEALSPAQLEPAPETDAGAPFTRRARATAVGDLLLHGFRVVRRAPLEAEFGFTTDRHTPSTVLIRSRAPFVVSLETHGIRSVYGPSNGKAPATAAPPARDALISIELYGRKVD